MNLLIDINHPSQVHLFKHAIWEWQRRGHHILIVARDKDVTLQLLDEYKFDYLSGTTRKTGAVNLLVELVLKTALINRVGREFQPDLLMSLGSPPAAWAAKLLGRDHIAFTDTEHSTEQLLLYKPFSARIYTPDGFLRDLGRKQRRYAGYHELAYLHPKYFQPNHEVLEAFGLDDGKDFFILRLVSFDATHDIGKHGIEKDSENRLLQLLSQFGRIIVSSEKTRELKLWDQNTTIPPTKIHDLLYFSKLCITDGATMATEAAILGTPAITITPFICGNIIELEKEYGLVKSVKDTNGLFGTLEKYLEDPDLKRKWAERHKKLLANKIDVTAYMVAEIENYFADRTFALDI